MNLSLFTVGDVVEQLKGKFESDGSIDYIQWYQQTNIITRILSLVLGLLICLILLLVPLVVSLELIYVAFPFVREKMDELSVSLEGKGLRHKALGFALRDAKEAVERANTTQVGKPAMTIYLWLKLKSMMFLMYIISWVVCGTTPMIRNTIFVMQGLIDTLGRIFGL